MTRAGCTSATVAEAFTSLDAAHFPDAHFDFYGGHFDQDSLAVGHTDQLLLLAIYLPTRPLVCSTKKNVSLQSMSISLRFHTFNSNQFYIFRLIL